MTPRRIKSKICLVGENAVGKTSLIKRFVLDIFDDSYLSTLGTKVSKRSMVIEIGGEAISSDLMIWDIMGQSSFRTLLREAYFHGANGVMAVCDLTRSETLPALDDWIAEMRGVTGDVPVVFLANKEDLKDQITITEKEMAEAARRYASPYFYTSAKTGNNVTNAFEQIAGLSIRRQLDRDVE
ncbi:MAG: Rab family GTPase [Candidatus Thermoplasmatota archaeon]